MNEDHYIAFENISKRFPGCVALDDVSFSIKKGEIHTLLGENGAGKSTLLNILHGIYQPSDGTVSIDGKKVSFHSAHEAILFGIAKVHQEINVVPDMTVAQNIMLGCEPKKGIFIDYKKMNEEAETLLKRLKTNVKPTDKVGTLSTGQMQVLQIAKALHVNAKIISFDEPTSSLSANETETLFEIIGELKQQGITIIYISHRMEEIFRLSDRTTVLRDGKYIGTYEMQGLTKEKLIHSMIGRDVSMFAKRHKPSQVVEGEYVLEVKNLSKQGVFQDISFKLKKGEILGFFGLVGAKRTDVVQAVFGAEKITGGEIFLKGEKIVNRSPHDAVKRKIGLLPENRKTQGFVKDLSNASNICLPSLEKYTKKGLVNHKAKKKRAFELGKKVNLKPEDPDFMTVNLSGGNQQKVIIAKWLSTDADILIFDEPTKGIDVGTKAEIYHLMEELVAQGKSIIMVSSELPEVIGMSDRIIIMHEGEITGEMMRSEFSEDALLNLALGGN